MEKVFNKIIFLTGLVGVLFAGSALPLAAEAASLYFSPSSATHNVGDVFTVGVYVASPDKTMNAASGELVFDADVLDIISLSKAGSIFNVWVQDPSFSNGKADFEGIVLNPGFIGTSGKILGITFKAKATGKASLSFLSASVLANDGKGTNILDQKGDASFIINSGISSVQKESTPAVYGLPLAPMVQSSTHPDPEKWYSTSNANFTWMLPKDVVDVNFAVNTQSIFNPDKNRGPVDSADYKNLEDGVWYLHVKFKNANGWGPSSHVKFKIDTRPPNSMTLSFPHGNVVVDKRPVVLFNTKDSLSGIRSYEVKVGDKNYYTLLPGDVVESNPYVIPPQDPGKYSIKVIAYDRAGNTSEASGEFEIIALNPPTITSVPSHIFEGDLLKIKGKTYPMAIVVVFLENVKTKEITQETSFTNALGQFTLVWPTYMKSGSYRLNAMAIDENENKSTYTEPFLLSVQGHYLFRIGPVMVTPWILASLVALLLFFLIAWVAYYVYRFKINQSILQKRFRAMESELNALILHMSQDLLKDDKSNLKAINETIKKTEKIIKNMRKL